MAQDRLQALLLFHEEDPEDAFVRFAIASEYLKRGHTDEAISFFEQLVGDRPDYVGTYYHLGKLYQQLSRSDDAILTYRKGIRVAENQNDFHAKAELQDALMEAQGIGFDDD